MFLLFGRIEAILHCVNLISPISISVRALSLFDFFGFVSSLLMGISSLTNSQSKYSIRHLESPSYVMLSKGILTEIKQDSFNVLDAC